MKRSKAIELLKNIVFEHMNCTYDCCQTEDDVYSKILKEIESEIGMFPPYGSIAEEPFGYNEGYIYRPQWEDEI